jgi:hypothetical protein
LIFKSKFAAFRVHVRPELVKYHPTTGVEIGREKAIVAEFGSHGGEFTYTDPNTGRLERGAFINGFTWDSRAAQEQNGWTDDERETAESIVAMVAAREPEHCWLYSSPAVEKPWPKYDDAHHNQVPVLAEQLGLVAEALAYEEENKNRESVVQKLREILDSQQQAAELTAA